MATLVVESGAGIASANTYASADWIDDYCEDRGYDTWETGGSDEAVAAILRSMNYLESLNFKGTKYVQDNPLEFPRGQLIDRNGYLIGYNEIPVQLKKALAEGAVREYESTRAMQEDLARGGKISKEKIDVIETDYFESAPSNTVFPVINGLLKGLIYSKGTLNVVRS